MSDSLFSKLFGGVKREVNVSHKSSNKTVDAIQKLAEQEELLEKRKALIEKKIAAEIEKAKQYLKAGNKSGAQACLKKKALLLKQMENIDNNIQRISEQLGQLEDTQITIQTVAAMHQGAQAQKANMQEFNIDKVDKVMEEIQEASDQVTEIQQALAVPLGGGVAIDEDDLEEELAAMEAEQLEAELLAPAAVPTTVPTVPSAGLSLPSVPTGAPVKPAKTTEDELAELEKELMAS